jgi:chromosomal replication initiation ATPase DnaA
METELMQEVKKIELLHDEPIEDHDFFDIQNRLSDEDTHKQKIEMEEKKRQAMLDSRETILNIIFLVVCKHFNIPRENISIDTRYRDVVEPRQMITSFSYKYLNQKFIYSYYKYSLQTIGDKVGGKHHTTVLHSIKTVNNQFNTDKKFCISYFDMDGLIVDKMKENDVLQYIKV